MAKLAGNKQNVSLPQWQNWRGNVVSENKGSLMGIIISRLSKKFTETIFLLQDLLAPKFWPCVTVFLPYACTLHELHPVYEAMSNSLSSSFNSFPYFYSTSTSPSAIVVSLSLLANIFNKQRWNLVNIVFMVAQLGNKCFESNVCVRDAKMFLTSGKNMFCFRNICFPRG